MVLTYHVTYLKRKVNLIFRYHIDNKVLECSQKEKYLGVKITDNLSWSTHIQYIILKKIIVIQK